MAKTDPPSALEIDALLTGDSTEDNEALWSALVRASGSGDRWRRAQEIRGKLDPNRRPDGSVPLLVAPWPAIRATRRLVGPGSRRSWPATFLALPPSVLGELGPTDGSGPADRTVGPNGVRLSN